MQAKQFIILISILAIQFVTGQDENVTETTIAFDIQRGNRLPNFYVQKYGCDDCETLIINIESLEEVNTKKVFNWQINKGLKVQENEIQLEKTDGNVSKVQQILYTCNDCDVDGEQRSVFHGDIELLLFKEGGEYLIKDQAIWVQEGSFKINLDIKDWEFSNEENEIIWRISFQEYYHWSNYSGGDVISNQTEPSQDEGSGESGNSGSNRFLQNQSYPQDQEDKPPSQYDNSTYKPDENFTTYDDDWFLPQDQSIIYYGEFQVQFPYVGQKYDGKFYEKTDIKVNQEDYYQISVRIPNFGDKSLYYDPTIYQALYYYTSEMEKNSEPSDESSKPKKDSSSLLQALLAFVILLL